VRLDVPEGDSIIRWEGNMAAHDSEGRGAQVIELTDTRAPSTSWEGLRAFQRAWFRAVALAWSDAAMCEALMREPARFLETHCGYALPGSVDVTVREVGDLPVNGAPRGWDAQREAWTLPKTELTLYLPPAPKLEERDVAMAELADSDDPIIVCC
jgi:ribosomally synthesized peptide (two-chain TOMM family)